MVNPSFAGRSSISVRMRRFVEDQQHLYNQVVVDLIDDEGERITPLATQLEEIGAVDVHAILGQVRDVQITRSRRSSRCGATRTITSPPSEERSRSSRRHHSVPLGLFENSSGREQPYAFLTGIVRDGGERTSSISGKPFVWALVETHGASFDVVATPKQVRAAFGIGSVIQGQFWLMGRLREEGE